MASNLVAQPNSNGLQLELASNLAAMASNLGAMAPNLTATAPSLTAMTPNLSAMALNPRECLLPFPFLHALFVLIILL